MAIELISRMAAAIDPVQARPALRIAVGRLWLAQLIEAERVSNNTVKNLHPPPHLSGESNVLMMLRNDLAHKPHSSNLLPTHSKLVAIGEVLVQAMLVFHRCHIGPHR